MEDERSRARQVLDDGETSVQRQIEDQRRQIQEESLVLVGKVRKLISQMSDMNVFSNGDTLQQETVLVGHRYFILIHVPSSKCLMLLVSADISN